MQEQFSTVQVRNAKALLKDMCSDISVIDFDKRLNLSHICDIIIMRIRAARLPELFTDRLISIINSRTIATLLESITILENKIKEAEN